MNQYFQYPLIERNTFGIAALTYCFAQYSSVRELQDFISTRHTDEPLFHLGGGSNVLFLADYPGTILHSCIHSVSIDGNLVRAGSGIVWDNLVALTLSKGLYGLENLSFIPGEVGASAVQNIGAYGSEVANFIEAVEAVDLTTGEQLTFAAADCHYAYRRSRFKEEWKGRYAVTHVVYRLSPVFEPNLTYAPLRPLADEPALTAGQVRQAVGDIRRSRLPDPAQLGNAGSFFTNPIVPTDQAEELLARYPQMPCFSTADGRSKLSAAWLIDQAGWRGRSLGRAAVYEKQPLVLVNLGGATGSDLSRLAQAIIADVEARFGIVLTPEVNFV